MKLRYFVKLSYLGTEYSGWQIQPNAISIQELLQDNLTKLNKNVPVKIMGCGRTDAGVHARNFYMHMDFDVIDDIDHFIYKMNHMLPKDIVIHNIFEVPEKSHTRFHATQRTYHYDIHTFKDPFIHKVSTLYTDDLNFDLMNEAAATLLTYTNFKSFCRAKQVVHSFDCELTEAKWVRTENGYRFIISANRFLRNMVRAIVGTMFELGIGKITLDDFKRIIESQNRENAGMSAKPNGLSLVQIDYPKRIPLN